MTASASTVSDSRYSFEDATRSVVVHDTRLPGPWSNYLSNGTLHALVSHACGGFAWWRSPLTYRLTRYRHHHQPIDSPGFYIYLREADGEVWSPSFRPCERTDTLVEARHQPGVSTFVASHRGLTATLSLFVLPDHDTLCWDLTLRDDGSTTTEPRPISVFAYAELSQHQWMNENQFGYYIRNMVKGWFDEDAQAVKYIYHEPNQPRVDLSPMVYFASTALVTSWSAHRDRFLGNYGSESLPAAVANNYCGNDALPCGEACVALQTKVEISGGSSQRIAFLLGAEKGALQSNEQCQASLADRLTTLRDFSTLDGQRAKLDAWWSEHFSVYQADIPDASAARMINIWSPVNTVQTSRYSRAVNQLAPGIRAVGYRDTCQDMLGMCYRKPDWAIENLGHLMAHQFEDGHALHLYSLEGDLKPVDSVHSDNHLWPPLLAHAILAETNDAAFLNTTQPYVTSAGAKTTHEASIWEHLLQGIRFTENNLGAHKLPLTFKGDWNDIIGKFSRQGRGESVFAGQQYLVALDRLIDIAEHTSRSADAEWLRDCHARMQAALLEHAWDGGWWSRGFDDDGNAVGSKDRPFGCIFLNPQSWAVLAGLGTTEQRVTGMDAVAEHLDAGVGLKAMAPGFKTFPEDTDPFAGYGPGCAENGSIFCHANTWAIIAECLLGRADRAWRYFSQLIPENIIQSVGLDRYEAEPYAWMSMVTGPENERFGWANTIHISGTAAWMDVVATQYILGVRAELAGLRIDPRIPADWPEYTVTRRYAGTTATIRVSNPAGAGQGVASAQVNGQAIALDSNDDARPASVLIPRATLEAQDATIEVVLG